MFRTEEGGIGDRAAVFAFAAGRYVERSVRRRAHRPAASPASISA
jgi:hypothetical protein